MEQRQQFVLEYGSGEWTMTELCQAYGISRPTGYGLLRRYAQWGERGLQEQSRAPGRHPNQTAPEREEAVLELRRQHPCWGRARCAGGCKRYIRKCSGQRPAPSAVCWIGKG